MTAQEQLLQQYGLPNTVYIQVYCHIWEVQKDFSWFPALHFLVNDEFKAKLFTAFTNLEAKGLHTEIKTFDGCYNDRNVRGSSQISLHSYAAAIDLNSACDPMIPNADNLTQAQRLGTWSQEFVDTMIAAGIFFGGNFKHRSDSMHFALLDG